MAFYLQKQKVGINHNTMRFNGGLRTIFGSVTAVLTMIEPGMALVEKIYTTTSKNAVTFALNDPATIHSELHGTNSHFFELSKSTKKYNGFDNHYYNYSFPRRHFSQRSKLFSTSSSSSGDVSAVKVVSDEESEEEGWIGMLPFEKGSHNSAKIIVPENNNDADSDNDHDSRFEKSQFQSYLSNTVEALKELGKSSVWVQVPMCKASLIEEMVDLGFEYHHASGEYANLNLWLSSDTESKIPEFATHHVGVGAVVLNSRNEILCVRELSRNFMRWKIPGGLSELGEDIPDAAIREVMEETGIVTKFRSIISFRHTHGMSNGRSDLYFICHLDPIEDIDSKGNVIIPKPIPQAGEIEEATWVPLEQYRAMINGEPSSSSSPASPGHPMMKQVMEIFDQGGRINKTVVHSVVPGRKPNPIYLPDPNSNNN